MTILSNPFRTLAGVMLMVPILSRAQAPAAVAGNADARPAVIRALDGKWIMSGDVMGEPVRYDMVAAPALQGTFTELRMKDSHVPAQYEATVFIGHDAGSGSVIVHWMDSFGAKYSIPHATGQIDGNTIRFTFPYKSGQFRDTFTYDPATASWTFVLESGQADGSWKHFARYKVTRQ